MTHGRGAVANRHIANGRFSSFDAFEPVLVMVAARVKLDAFVVQRLFENRFRRGLDFAPRDMNGPFLTDEGYTALLFIVAAAALD